MVFFHEQYNTTSEKNPQFNFSSQNLSVERKFISQKCSYRWCFCMSFKIHHFCQLL